MCADALLQFPESFRGKFIVDTLFLSAYEDCYPFCTHCSRDACCEYICPLCYVCWDCEREHHPADHHFISSCERWDKVLHEYSNQPVFSPQSDVILSDCSVKINALDPINGLGLLHGLLATKDDLDLIQLFLELGVNAEACFMPPKSKNQAPPDDGAHRKLYVMSDDLKGATPLHFAAKYGRTKSLEALLAVGVNLQAKTCQGLTAREIEGVPAGIRDALAAAERAPYYPTSFAQLAKEKKWFAMRYRMRRQQVGKLDLEQSFHSKTATEWVLATAMEETDFSKWNELGQSPFRVLAEMKYRHGADEELADKPAVMALTASRSMPPSAEKQNCQVATAEHLRTAMYVVMEGLNMLKS